VCGTSPPRSAACPAHTWTAGISGPPAHTHLGHPHGEPTSSERWTCTVSYQGGARTSRTNLRGAAEAGRGGGQRHGKVQPHKNRQL
jgi:hypothetical protein